MEGYQQQYSLLLDALLKQFRDTIAALEAKNALLESNLQEKTEQVAEYRDKYETLKLQMQKTLEEMEARHRQKVQEFSIREGSLQASITELKGLREADLKRLQDEMNATYSSRLKQSSSCNRMLQKGIKRRDAKIEDLEMQNREAKRKYEVLNKNITGPKDNLSKTFEMTWKKFVERRKQLSSSYRSCSSSSENDISSPGSKLTYPLLSPSASFQARERESYAQSPDMLNTPEENQSREREVEEASLTEIKLNAHPYVLDPRWENIINGTHTRESPSSTTIEDVKPMLNALSQSQQYVPGSNCEGPVYGANGTRTWASVVKGNVRIKEDL